MGTYGVRDDWLQVDFEWHGFEGCIFASMAEKENACDNYGENHYGRYNGDSYNRLQPIIVRSQYGQRQKLESLLYHWIAQKILKSLGTVQKR